MSLRTFYVAYVRDYGGRYPSKEAAAFRQNYCVGLDGWVLRSKPTWLLERTGHTHNDVGSIDLFYSVRTIRAANRADAVQKLAARGYKLIG